MLVLYERLAFLGLKGPTDRPLTQSGTPLGHRVHGYSVLNIVLGCFVLCCFVLCLQSFKRSVFLSLQ